MSTSSKTLGDVESISNTAMTFLSLSIMGRTISACVSVEHAMWCSTSAMLFSI